MSFFFCGALFSQDAIEVSPASLGFWQCTDGQFSHLDIYNNLQP